MLTNDNQTEACGECKKAFGSDECAVQCDGPCGLWYHRECSGMTKGEFDILRRENCKLIWLCSTCKPTILCVSHDKEEKLQEIETKLDKIKHFLDNDLGKTISDVMEKSLNSLTNRPTVIIEPGKSQQRPRDNPRKNRDVSEPSTNLEIAMEQPTENSTESSSENLIERQLSDRSTDEPTNETNTFARETDDFNRSEWTEVVRRRNRNNNRIIGTRQNGESSLRAGQRFAWLYVGRLHSGTTPEDIKSYLSENEISGDIICEDLNSRGHNKAFKVGIHLEELEKVEDEHFWPRGVIMRQFRFRNHGAVGVRLH